MNVDVEVQILKDLPIDKINKYVDLVIYGIARNTLDYTMAENRFPYKTGNLQRSSMAQGVRQEQNGTYCLDIPENAQYAVFVWDMPQETTNWTNPDTYAKWYLTTFQNKKEVITQQAIDNAKRSINE